MGEGSNEGHQEGGLVMASAGQGRRGSFLSPGRMS